MGGRFAILRAENFGGKSFGGDRGRWKSLPSPPRAPSPRRAAPRAPPEEPRRRSDPCSCPSVRPVNCRSATKSTEMRGEILSAFEAVYNVAIERRRRAIRREFVRRVRRSAYKGKAAFAPALPVASLVPPRANDRVPLRARIVQIAHVYWGARRRRRRRLVDRTRRRDGEARTGVTSVSQRNPNPPPPSARRRRRRRRRAPPAPRGHVPPRRPPPRACARRGDASRRLSRRRALRGTDVSRAPRRARGGRARRQPPPERERDGGGQEGSLPARRERNRQRIGVLRDGVFPRARGGDQLGNQAHCERALGKTRARRCTSPRRLRRAFSDASLGARLSGASSERVFVAAPSLGGRPHQRHQRVRAPARRSRGRRHQRGTRRIDEVQERQPRERGATATSSRSPADAERLAARAPARARFAEHASPFARIHASAYSAWVSKRRASKDARRPPRARRRLPRFSRRLRASRAAFAFRRSRSAREPAIGDSVTGRRRRGLARGGVLPLARRARRRSRLRGRGATPRASSPARAWGAPPVVLAVRQLQRRPRRAASSASGSARTRAAWRRVDVAARLSCANATAASSESGASSVSASARETFVAFVSLSDEAGSDRERSERSSSSSSWPAVTKSRQFSSRMPVPNRRRHPGVPRVALAGATRR